MISEIIFKLKSTISKKKSIINKKEANKINFGLLEKLCIYHKKTDTSLDEITWHDLDMNKVFAKINNTTTTAGEETLFFWMYNPLNDISELNQRKNHIESLERNVEQVNNIRTELSKLRYITYDFRDIIMNGFISNVVLLILYTLLAVFSFSSIMYALITLNSEFIVIILIAFIINIVIHYLYTKKIASQIEVLSYMVGLLSKCRSLSKLTKDSYPELSKELEQLFIKLRPIYSKSSIIFKLEGVDIFADYINILFLVKEIRYLMVAKYIEKNISEIIRLYEAIGELDALMSIVIYRSELDYYCIPELDEKYNELSIKEVYHPLLKYPIGNDVLTNNCVAITGSNMSGKSTFLRTIGINTIFAQSIVTCLAVTYKSKFLRVLTSINLTDNIITGSSYFLAEAEAIKRMVEKVNSSVKSLILIDEIFKGTNPTERIAASIEILNLLAEGNTITFVATHDLQILPYLKEYEYYYFAENVTDKGMEFEYKFKKGIVPTKNAIKILSYLNYPENLLSKIEERFIRINI